VHTLVGASEHGITKEEEGFVRMAKAFLAMPGRSGYGCVVTMMGCLIGTFI
jgi:hypothetical protein